MNNEKNGINQLFGHLDGQWDTEEPADGHQERFLDRLEINRKKKKKTGLLYRLTFPAAAVVILLGAIFTYTTDMQHNAPATVAKVSPKVKQTELYFASIIEKELAKVAKENSPETKVLVQDALARMDTLEKDYQKLMQELARNGESKQLIHAMITNLQTRIAFLEDVLDKIEDIKQIKENYHENNPL